MEVMWAESDCRTPMICFLSMGSDPTDNIERLAKSKGIRMYHLRICSHYMQNCPFSSFSIF